MVSLDGYFEGEGNDLNWHNVDQEFNNFALGQLSDTGLLIFGRRTYETMKDFWTSPTAFKKDRNTAMLMNKIKKIVFSKTLGRADWKNTTLLRFVSKEQIIKLKKEEGKDIAIFGSSDLSVSFVRLGLIDELRLMINPVLLGKGRSFLAGVKGNPELRLVERRVFKSGNVLLTYRFKVSRK